MYQRRAQLAAVFGGEQGLVVLTDPDKTEAYRLKAPQEPPIVSDRLEDFPVEYGPVALSQPDLAQLQAVLPQWSSYGWDNAKACNPTYGVRLDFTRGNDRLRVLICFECDILGTWLNGRFVGGGDFDPARTELVRIVKAIFPNDALIQALK